MINATCGIVLKNSKILVTQRSEKMQLALKWEFPGGKIEEFFGVLSYPNSDNL
ncbi:MAG: NUDIX domain-containing protein [Cyclobacteriaceae bacterium]